jgi:glycerol-3-phosphate acyltransferase PlsY
MALTIAILSYLLGSIPTGYILGLCAGVDVRKTGSGNIGATNVARAVGKGQGVATLLADVAKGFIPAYLATQLGLAQSAAAIIGAAAFLGHLYPIFLKFKGGKGVATALGVMLALAPMAALVLLVAFAVVMLASRIVSLSSMAGALTAPIALWLLDGPATYLILALFLAAMIIVRHRGNIQRLLAGTEPQMRSS